MRKLRIPVIRGVVLGVTVYRGYAKLCDLASISKADIYDQQLNPKGTQRDLSPKHAKDAYEYVKTRDFAFWPEVFLCARMKNIAEFIPSKSLNDVGILEIDLNATNRKGRVRIAISRIDGNHRLHYADGDSPDFPAIDKTVSFCMAYGLTQEEEIVLFRDINDNQKAMNTSHLDNIEIRLTPEETLKRNSPDLYIAQQLGRDPKSPLYERVFEGGKKSPTVDIPLRSLRTGVTYLLSKSSQLPLVPDADAQFRLIRNFFSAMKRWQPKAWSNPREYIVLRGAGLWAVCFIGAVVIDKVLLTDQYKIEDMLRILKSGKAWDWSNGGDFKGFSGRGGALEICKKVARDFGADQRMSTKDLYARIMEDD